MPVVRVGAQPGLGSAAMAADDLDLTAHAARNREVWNADAPNWVASGRKAWASPTPWWGMWEVPEEEVRILPDVAGLDVLDLGCGTGYWCAWFHRLGARPVGLDLSEEQLATARELQAEHGIEFPLIHASAEAPPLPGRLVRRGLLRVRRRHLVRPVRVDSRGPPAAAAGRPADLPVPLGARDALLAAEREPTGETLVRPQRGLHRIEWPDPDGTDFHQSSQRDGPAAARHGLRGRGAARAVRARRRPDEVRYFMRRGWAQQWPCEEVWVARR